MESKPVPYPRGVSKADQAILDEMHERWTYATDEWRPIRDEARTDMRYVAGDPWDPKDRQARIDAGRPCLQHKRAIQVTPLGNGANDATANFRANLIRQIEYRSNAQQAYTTTFENTVQRSYGFHRIKPRYVSDRSDEQELIIEPIVNPDLVTVDPDIQKPDGSLEVEETKGFWRDDARAKVKLFVELYPFPVRAYTQAKTHSGWDVEVFR